MKAIQINAYGGNEVLAFNDNAVKPTLAPGQVLVEVHAAGLNPIDRMIRAGYLKEMMPLTFPATLGGDFSGVVAEVGSTGSGFNAGDLVYGQAIVMNGGSGSLAQFVAANATNTARKPRTVSDLEAAALPLAGASALQGLEEHIGLQRGQRILIHGGAGGIGTTAIQLAKHLGAYVATTVSAKDLDYAKALGADQVIDYQNERFEQVLSGFDAVFDNAGGDTTKRSFGVLKRGGILVSMAGQPDAALAEKHGVKAIGQFTKTSAEQLNRLADLVDRGVIRIQVDRVFSLQQAAQAFEHLENGHPRGKVVVQVAG